jgi:hypothetical protein
LAHPCDFSLLCSKSVNSRLCFAGFLNFCSMLARGGHKAWWPFSLYSEKGNLSCGESVLQGKQWIFLAPCSNKFAQQHLQDTVLKGVKFADIEGYLSEKDAELLRNKDPLRIWGNKPKRASSVAWEHMGPGDFVLFYQHGNFTYAGKIFHRMDNENLSKKLWPPCLDKIR